MLARTSRCLERIVPQGNCAALSLPGPDHSPPNTWSRHQEMSFVFWKGTRLGFSSFSFTCLCITKAFLVFLWEFHSIFFGQVIQYYCLGELCKKDCLTIEHACVVLVEVHLKPNLSIPVTYHIAI